MPVISLIFGIDFIYGFISSRKYFDVKKLEFVRKSDLCEFILYFESLTSESIIRATTINHAMNI